MNMDLSPLLISLKTAFTATIITFFIGIAAAWWMEGYRGTLKGIVDTIFTLPLVLPPTVVGFFLLLMLGRNGPIGKLLLHFNRTIVFSWAATVIASSVVAFPMMYKTSMAAFEQIDINLLNAARTLGIQEWRIFWKIALPLAWPGIAAATVLTFARALGEFGATMMIAGNIPGKTQTIPVAIYFQAEGGEMDKALIWVLIIIGVSATVILLMDRWNKKMKKYATRSRR